MNIASSILVWLLYLGVTIVLMLIALLASLWGNSD